MRNRRQLVLLFIIVGVASALGGCGANDERFEIRGQVTFQSEPIGEGKILFMPVDESRPQAISQIVGGEYKTGSPGGVFPGEYKVQIFGCRGTGEVQDLGKLYGKREQQVQYVPAKFNHATELTVKISAEETEYDFGL